MTAGGPLSKTFSDRGRGAVIPGRNWRKPARMLVRGADGGIQSNTDRRANIWPKSAPVWRFEAPVRGLELSTELRVRGESWITSLDPRPAAA